MARTKYSMHFCVYCNKDTRMEMMNEAHGSADKIWLRCSRCHHMSMMESPAKTEADAKGKAEAGTATPYNPQESFEVGQSIFHAGWNDTGRVVSKTKTSDGCQAIVVSFEKQGQRRLIENLKAEELEETKDAHQVLS
jgi:CxxC motif-containing protein (DUF1111 family)